LLKAHLPGSAVPGFSLDPAACIGRDASAVGNRGTLELAAAEVTEGACTVVTGGQVVRGTVGVLAAVSPDGGVRARAVGVARAQGRLARQAAALHRARVRAARPAFRDRQRGTRVAVAPRVVVGGGEGRASRPPPTPLLAASL